MCHAMNLAWSHHATPGEERRTLGGFDVLGVGVVSFLIASFAHACGTTLSGYDLGILCLASRCLCLVRGVLLLDVGCGDGGVLEPQAQHGLLA